MFCFKTDNSGKISDLNVIDSSELGTDFTYVFCGLDKHSFASYPFRDEKEGSDDRDNSWMPRYIAEYHRTALWEKRACPCAQPRVLHIADCKRPPDKPSAAASEASLA
jgi:hypothetical protein